MRARPSPFEAGILLDAMIDFLSDMAAHAKRLLHRGRPWMWVLGGLLTVVVGYLWVSSVAASRASAVIERRLQMEVDVGDAGLTLGGVTLQDVRAGPGSSGLEILLDYVVVDLSWGRAIVGGDAIRGVRVNGVAVRIDLADEVAAESISRLRDAFYGRATDQPGGQAATGRRSRIYRVSDAKLLVEDAEGALIEVEGLKIVKEGHSLQGEAAGTVLGERGADVVEVGSSRVALTRGQQGWSLGELHVTGGHAKWVPSDLSQPLARRLKRAADLLRAPDAGASEPVRANDRRGPMKRWFARLTPDVVIDLSFGSIESESVGGGADRLEDLALKVRGSGDGRYRLLGAGELVDSGEVRVDLSFVPEQARALGSVFFDSIPLALVAPLTPQVPWGSSDTATISGNLDLRTDSVEEMQIEGRVALRDVALSSERIAPEPIDGIDVSLAGQGVWFPMARLLRIDSGDIQVGPAHASIVGEIERGADYYRAELKTVVPPTDCNEVIAAIPRDILGPLSAFEWSGTWAANAELKLDSRDFDSTDLTIRVRNLCQFERTPKTVRVERFERPFTHRVRESEESVFEMVTGPGTPNWVLLADVSPFVVQAVISHEDARFYDHGGFAPWAIRDALARNLREGRYVVGASTISMQLAKNLFLEREKTVARKAQEVILTWWLENALTKDQILELYLNVIEYGPEVYGLREAAKHYFGREPRELSPAEAAFLACVLPSPKRYHAYYDRDALTPAMRNKMHRLLEHMAKRGRIGSEALAYGLQELEMFDFHQEGEGRPPDRELPPVSESSPEIELIDPWDFPFEGSVQDPRSL